MRRWGCGRDFCKERTPTQVASHAQKYHARLAAQGLAGKRASRFAQIEAVRALFVAEMGVISSGPCCFEVPSFRIRYFEMKALCTLSQAHQSEAGKGAGPESSIARAQGLLGLQTPDVTGFFRSHGDRSSSMQDDRFCYPSSQLQKGYRNPDEGMSAPGTYVGDASRPSITSTTACPESPQSCCCDISIQSHISPQHWLLLLIWKLRPTGPEPLFESPCEQENLP